MRLNTVDVHKVNPERISKACPKLFCSKFLVVAFVSSWANLKTNLGSYTPGNLQLQATVSSNINGFLARLQPLHLDHDYVGKGRSNISKSTLFIQEAWQMTCACWGFEKNRQTHFHLQLSPNVKTNAKNFGPPLFHKINYLLCVLWSQTLLAPTVLALSVCNAYWKWNVPVEGSRNGRQTHLQPQLSPNVTTNAKSFGPPVFNKMNYLRCLLWSQTLLVPTVLVLSVCNTYL